MPRGLGSSLSSHPQHRALPPQQHAGSLSQQGIMRHGERRWTFPVRGGVSGEGYILNGSSGSGADTCGGNGGAGAGGSCGGADHSRSLSAHPLTRDLSDLGRSASGTSLGSVSDMQQLVSAFARSAQTPPIGGAWSNGDGGATRGLSPPPPSWARAFAQSASGAISSTLGGGNGGGDGGRGGGRSGVGGEGGRRRREGDGGGRFARGRRHAQSCLPPPAPHLTPAMPTELHKSFTSNTQITVHNPWNQLRSPRGPLPRSRCLSS